jgi:inosine-uridine nucleoside N-ribohydrolase
MVEASLTHYTEAYALYGITEPPLHDPVAVYYVINPEAFTTKFLNVEVETSSKYCDGRTEIDYY